MTPALGEIWSERFKDRRVSVLEVERSGVVLVKSVERIGPDWKFVRLAKSRRVNGILFQRRFARLEVPA